MLTIQNDQITLEFCAPWDEQKYDLFIRSKQLPECNLHWDWKTDTYTITAPSRFAHLFGIDGDMIDRGWLPPAPHLFDYQTVISKIALNCKRFAVWADTGLGKTQIFFEFARQVNYRTGGKVLIVTKPDLIDQTVDECQLFGDLAFPIRRIKTRSELIEWLTDGVGDIGITNLQKFIPPKGGQETISECQHLAGFILDEASILKSGGGTIKWAIIKSARGIEYKLSCTATPAPNDTMEYASQGSFLEKIRSEGEVIWKFFTRSKDGEWKVKEHAKDAFYRFMAGWSIYLRDPKNYGFADNLKDLPDPEITEHPIDITPAQRKRIMSVPDARGQLQLFGTGSAKLGMVDRAKYSELAKGFIYMGKGKAQRVEHIDSLKPEWVARRAAGDRMAGHRVIVWTVFDEESRIISKSLKEKHGHWRVETLTGSMPKKKRADLIRSFKSGNVDILISKASLIGFGQNFQICTSMIFSGFNDSFEQFYQAIRRAYRYGQKQRVKVRIPFIPELEGMILDNIRRKEAQFIHDVAIQERNYHRAMKEELKHAA